MSAIRSTLLALGFTALGATMAVGGQAVARGGHGGPHGLMLARLADELDLTDAQRTQAEAIRDRAMEHREAQREARDADREEVLELLAQPKMDRDAVHARIDARAAEMTAIGHELADDLIDLHGTLSADQCARLVELAEERAERLDERGGPPSDERGEHGRDR